MALIETVSSAPLSLAPAATTPAARETNTGRLRLALSLIDPVLMLLAALFMGLWLFSATQASSTFLYIAAQLGHIAPWLAASVGIAAAAHATGADALAARSFTGREGRMIIVASLIGAALPFCSCGIIPLVAGLLGAGVPLAAVMAFWIASPLMDPTQFFIASGTIGLGFAVAKLVGAVGMGLLSGFGTMMLVRMRWLDAPAALRLSPAASASCCGSKAAQPAVASSCCGSAKPAPAPILWRFWTDAGRSQRFLATATSTGWFLIRGSLLPSRLKV